jgi:hypothetical protein
MPVWRLKRRLPYENCRRAVRESRFLKNQRAAQRNVLDPERCKNMRTLLHSIVLACLALACTATSGMCQKVSRDLNAKLDEVVLAAYQAATAGFPCRLKTSGKPRMLHWQQIGSCLQGAEDAVDWEKLSLQIQDLRKSSGLSTMDISAAVESSLSAHAVPYDKVFSVGVKDIEALLPLSNSLLRFLPEDSLLDFPVIDKSGTKVGTFSGVYTFETAGSLNAAKTYRLSVFQYADLHGNIQSGGKLLLDSFGVPWKGAKSQPGFRLPLDKLLSKR